MVAVEIVAMAWSFSLLAGWRVDAAVLVAGVAMDFDIVSLPEQFQSLGAPGSPWVIGLAATGAVAEFFADKVPLVDSAWDAVHSFVRPVVGAVVAMAIIDPGDPVCQVATLLPGGGSAFLSHGGKATRRAAINTSPEPRSNIVTSAGEDGVTTGACCWRCPTPSWLLRWWPC